MDFEVGKLYRTRDGRKAFVSVKGYYGPYPFAGVIEGDNVISKWLKDGRSLRGQIEPMGTDLIGPWEEHPELKSAHSSKVELPAHNGEVLGSSPNGQTTDYKSAWRQYACAALTALISTNAWEPETLPRLVATFATAMMQEEAKR